MNRQSAQAAFGASEAPFSPALVEGLVQLFAKAARAQQLYLPNNPMYQRAIDQLRAGFAAIWEETDQLTLGVLETEFRWEGITIAHDGTRSESLAWLFYKDGVRALTFLPGVEGDELVRLLTILQRVRRTSNDDDLLTLLWEEDFIHLRYRYVDVGEDPGGTMAPTEATTSERQVDPGAIVAEATREPAPAFVRMQDFDSALYFLDEQEIDYIRRSFAEESIEALRRNITAILYDIYELEADASVRGEIAGILDQLVLHFLAAGDFRTVAYLVREAHVAAERARGIDAEQRERLLAVAARIGSPEALAQLLQTLDEARDLPPPEELDELFDVLGAPALATVLLWLGRVQGTALRTALERAATRLASTNVGELVRLIGAADPELAMQAARRAGELRTPAAVSPLARLLSGQNPQLRLAATQALAGIASTGALQQLERAVDDSERDVRITAVRVLAARGHRAALARVEDAVQGRVLRSADLTEKMAYFEAYGVLAGSGGVPQLDTILNGRGLFGPREEAETRACAAMALGKVGDAAALDSLRRAASDKDVVVRNAVAKALRGGGG